MTILAYRGGNANLPREEPWETSTLTLACWNYDRTRALAEGRVPSTASISTYLNLPVEETFFRMLRYHEFDAAEMSLSSYVMSLFSDDPPFIAIPVFPSRSFRHSCIFVNRHSGIREPKDLIGKKVGSSRISTHRARLDSRHPERRICRAGRQRALFHRRPGRSLAASRKIKLVVAAGDSRRADSPGKTLSKMLDAGEIDALYTPRMPSTFLHGSGSVRRLVRELRRSRKGLFPEDRIFPIMHTVVIRRDVYEKHPWVAQSLYKAFVAAQRETYKDFYEAAALKHMLPWLLQHVEETASIMGEDFWPYGFEPNLAHARNVSALFARAGPFQAASRTSRAFRARNFRIFQDLASVSKRPESQRADEAPFSERWWIPERGDIDVIVAQVGFNLAQMVIPVFLLLPLGISLDFGVTHFCPAMRWDSWSVRWALRCSRSACATARIATTSPRTPTATTFRPSSPTR